eukprot:11621867-Ditylum_brightwellii.AAC.1
MDLKPVEAFIEGITSNFIPKMYQKAVYLKDRLVMLYDTYIELAEVLKNNVSTDDEELTSDIEDVDKIGLNQQIAKRMKRDRAKTDITCSSKTDDVTYSSSPFSVSSSLPPTPYQE